MSETIEWLRKTYKKPMIGFGGIPMCGPRKWAVCRDGFTVSIQAGRGPYCTPSTVLKDCNYQTVELGFPNMADDIIMEYAENSGNPTDTVYANVPIEVVDELLAKHGGIKDD